MTHTAIVTSSRTYTKHQDVNDYLFTLAQRNNWELIVRHGDAPKGGDRFASQFCRVFRDIYPGIVEDRHPAKWTEPGGIKNIRAGFDRNSIMAGLGADECGVFMMPCRDPKCRRKDPHGTHGTEHCVEACEAQGIRIVWHGYVPPKWADRAPA